MNRRGLAGLLLLFALGSCDGFRLPAPSLSELKAASDLRSAKLAAFHLVGKVTERGQVASFEVFYRPPDRIRAVLTSPAHFERSYDGTWYFELDPATKRLARSKIELSPADKLLFLTEQFDPFVPEGYRPPLIPSSDATVRWVRHRSDQVDLTACPKLPGGDQTCIRRRLRWPSLDFVELESPSRNVTVEKETCDAPRGICVPSALMENRPDGSSARTEVTTATLGAAIPFDRFSLQPSPAFTLEERKVTSRPSTAPAR